MITSTGPTGSPDTGQGRRGKDTMDTSQLRRYQRHLTLPEVGLDGQERLLASSVLVVGAGGLGSPALLYLAAAGVGRITVVDDDLVDESNLQRQVLHDTSALGRPKVDSARERLLALNPQLELVTHRVRLDAGNAVELVRGHDVVCDGSDNFATRYLVNDACVVAGVPLVWASVLRFDGQLSTFWAGHGPCLRCVFPEPPDASQVPSCAEAGVLGAVVGTVGSMQASEALRLLLGIGTERPGRTLVGRLLVHDALRGTTDEVPVARDPDCRACGDGIRLADVLPVAEQACSVPAAAEPELPVEARLDPAGLARWLAEREAGTRDFDLVDVREPGEALVASIPGSRLVPLGGVAQEFAEMSTTRPVVLLCAKGIRSLRAAELGRAQGIEHLFDLEGGTTAWQQAGLPVVTGRLLRD